MLNFIQAIDTTTENDGDCRKVSFSYSDISHPDRLCLLGVLNHNTEITFDRPNAQKMINFLQKIVDEDFVDTFAQEHDMELIKVEGDIKKRDFLFVDGVFVLVTKGDEKNLVCVFDDEITEQARDFADQYTPETGYKYNDQTDKGRFIKGLLKQQRLAYWSSLWNLGIWDYLDQNNTVTYMKRV